MLIACAMGCAVVKVTLPENRLKIDDQEMYSWSEIVVYTAP
jgi:hypothetical protein